MKRGSKTLSIKNKNKFLRGYIMLTEHYIHGTWVEKINILYSGDSKRCLQSSLSDPIVAD